MGITHWSREIDERRSLTIDLPGDLATIVLLVEDPHGAAVVELTPAELDELVSALQDARRKVGG